MSVLFADLVGFTPYAAERDAEEVRETLTRYFDLAGDVIGRHGGTVEKFIGDAVMAVWGAPVAHEDDAERAVRAALELLDAVRSLDQGTQARAGVLTGEAAVTMGAVNQGLVAGDLVNTASRGSSRSRRPGPCWWARPPGGRHRARSPSSPRASWSCGGRTPRSPPGAPSASWRGAVGGTGARRSRPPSPAGTRSSASSRTCTRPPGGSAARLVSVIGHAGIGKTRLARELTKYLDGLADPAWCHAGRTPTYGDGITFWALGEMVRGRAGLAEGDDEPTTRAKIAETVRTHVGDPGEAAWIEPALLALLGVETGIGSDELFAAWRTFFERLAETAPVVMVFEDLQHADPGLLDFIDHVMEWSRGVPIMIITLARPELLDRRPDWGAGLRSFAWIHLEPLAASEMKRLLTGLVPGLPDKAAAAIVARADGVPLYAVETVRMLLAQGRLGSPAALCGLATSSVPPRRWPRWRLRDAWDRLSRPIAKSPGPASTPWRAAARPPWPGTAKRCVLIASSASPSTRRRRPWTWPSCCGPRSAMPPTSSKRSGPPATRSSVSARARSSPASTRPLGDLPLALAEAR